jgi:hypothetical protein
MKNLTDFDIDIQLIKKLKTSRIESPENWEALIYFSGFRSFKISNYEYAWWSILGPIIAEKKIYITYNNEGEYFEVYQKLRLDIEPNEQIFKDQDLLTALKKLIIKIL